MNQRLSPAHYGLPSIEDLTLSVEQAALLHLFDRLRQLEDRLAVEVLARDRAERLSRAQIERLTAEINRLRRA